MTAVALLTHNNNTKNIMHNNIMYLLRKLSGIQPAKGERRKAKNRQLRDSNPGCLTKAVINH